MILHLERFQLEELSEKGFQNLCSYCVKKGMLAKEMLPIIEDVDFRKKVMQTCQGHLFLTIGNLIDLLDQEMPYGAWDIKRNTSKTAWKIDHREGSINDDEQYELIELLWSVSKMFFEKGAIYVIESDSEGGEFLE